MEERIGSGGTGTRVLLVDDHEVVRAGLVALLSRAPDLEVVATASCARQAEAMTHRHSPDIALLDYVLPDGNGASLCEALIRCLPSLGVIILTSHVTDDVVHACLRAGARGFLTKDMPGGDVIHAIRAVARSDAVLAPLVTNRVVEWAREARFVQRQSADLTAREIQILALMGKGFSNADIAEHLKMNLHTARWYARRIKQKLGASGRADAVATAIQRGVI